MTVAPRLALILYLILIESADFLPLELACDQKMIEAAPKADPGTYSTFA